MTPLAKMRRQPRQARSQARVNHILDVAEQMFITEGYHATTTKAIAARSQVAIGSLYQFFPDKAALLSALAERYNQQLRQSLAPMNLSDNKPLSVSEYVERTINAVDHFFAAEYPGYHAIFIPLQGSFPELAAIDEATDTQLIQDLGVDLSRHYPGLASKTYRMIAFVLVKTISTLLWLSLSQEVAFRRQLLEETKRLALNYLQGYFPV